MLPTDTCCYLLSIDVYIDIICFMFLNNFLTEFLPKCYALLLMAFDCHTIKVYLLTYLLTYDVISEFIISMFLDEIS